MDRKDLHTILYGIDITSDIHICLHPDRPAISIVTNKANDAMIANKFPTFERTCFHDGNHSVVYESPDIAILASRTRTKQLEQLKLYAAMFE
jgi:hypothetical protein